jgi:hypothetical protein
MFAPLIDHPRGVVVVGLVLCGTLGTASRPLAAGTRNVLLLTWNDPTELSLFYMHRRARQNRPQRS